MEAIITSAIFAGLFIIIAGIVRIIEWRKAK